MSEFSKDLILLINRHSIENESNTADFILAEYIIGCLENYKYAVKGRDEFDGRKQNNTETSQLEFNFKGIT